MINQRATRDNVDKFLKTALPHFLLMRGMQGRELMGQGLSKKQCIKILECISKDRSNEDSEKFLKLENKIKLKLKAY